MVDGDVDLSRYPALNVRLADVASLRADPRNARLHDKANIDAIKESLDEHGQVKNIVVSADGVVKAGNGTLEAASQLGWTHIVVGPAPVDLAAAKKYALQDNRTAELAMWDPEILGETIEELRGDEIDVSNMGWNEEEIAGYVEIAHPSESPPEDTIPKRPKNPRTKVGDLWCLGEHRLVCGDSRDPAVWKRLLGDSKIRMVWTDPPFGVAIVGGNHSLSPEERLAKGGKTIENDTLSPDELQEFLRIVFENVKSHNEPGGAWYVKAPSGDLFYEFAHVLGRKGLDVWKHTLVWVKDRFFLARSDYHYRHESIFYGWVKGAGHYFVDDRTQDSVFEVARPSVSEEHPTMTPVELISRHVRNSSKRGWLVADPFAGSGSTLIACETEKRVAACIELDPGYCDVIVQRWENFTKKKAKRSSASKVA